MLNRLEGAKAFVTGANSGVGCTILEELARMGVDSVGGYVSEHAEAGVGIDGVRQRIAAIGGRFELLKLDQTKPNQITRAVAQAQKMLSGLDILVTVASRQSPEHFLDMTTDEITQQIAVNLTGTILLIREAARVMITLAEQEGAVKRHRAIGVMGSVRGAIPVKPDPYEFSKAGLHHLVGGLASVLGPHGISINEVAPFTIDSPIEHERYGGDPVAYRKAWGRVTPGGLATPESVAEAMYYLLNAGMSVNGTTVYVDGGYKEFPVLPLPPKA